MDKTPNRFLREADLLSPEYSFMKNAIEEHYINRWRGTPHPWGAKKPDTVKTHWSREWEYAWAVINSETEEGHSVLDCGCGGSPLLPFLAEHTNCNAYGIDLNYGDFLTSDAEALIKSNKPLANLRYFYVDPTFVSSKMITIQRGSMANMPYSDNKFDRVFCISVIEHIDEPISKQCIKEMVRVLKPGGRLLITMDHSSYKNHVHPWCLGKFKEIIELTGLKLAGEVDFSVPSDNEVHGMYHVVGFVLTKDKGDKMTDEDLIRTANELGYTGESAKAVSSIIDISIEPTIQGASILEGDVCGGPLHCKNKSYDSSKEDCRQCFRDAGC